MKIRKADPTLDRSARCELATFMNAGGPGSHRRQPVPGQPPPRARPSIGSPSDPGFGTLLQSYTEASNVDSVTEVTALIVAQRAYEMNSKVITTADQMLSSHLADEDVI